MFVNDFSRFGEVLYKNYEFWLFVQPFLKMATLNGKPLMSYRVVDLKEELEKRGLSKSGAKKDLVERLGEYILENEAEDKADPPSPDNEDAAPSIQIDTNLEENDIVKEYMMMRQNQFKSALEESGKKADSPKIAGETNEDEEDVPLSRNKSPRKRGRGRNSSAASDSDESVKSPAKRMKSPLNEALSPPPVPEESKSLSKRLKSPTSREVVEAEPELPQHESPSKRSRRTSNKVQSYEEPPDDDEPMIMPELIRKKPEVKQKLPVVEKPAPLPPKIEESKKTTAAAVETEESKVTTPDKKASKQPEKVEEEPSEPVTTKVEEDKLPSPTKTTTTTQVGKETKERETTKVEQREAKEAESKVRKVIEPEPTKEQVEEEAEEAVDEILVSETVTFDETKEEDSIVEGGDDESNENSNESKAERKEQPVTFRKLSRLGSNNETSTTRKKRTWGDSKKTAKPIEDIAVSSSELKDIIPDLKPVLEEIKHEEEQQKTTETTKEDGPKAESIERTKDDVELPKPTVEDPEKVASVSEKNKNQSKVVEIRNLVRPFTHNQLVQLLKRTGNFDAEKDFWIDKIKSHALVMFEKAAEAEETVMALDGVKWPSSNQKKLIVTFSSDDHFLRQSQSSVSLSKQPPRPTTSSDSIETSSHSGSSSAIKRSASENYEEGRERKRGRQDSEGLAGQPPQQGSQQQEKEAKKEQKSLEVLFQKTKALPSIYWMPKS